MRRAGPANGVPVILLHGFSYNRRGYDTNGAAADRRRVPYDREPRVLALELFLFSFLAHGLSAVSRCKLIPTRSFLWAAALLRMGLAATKPVASFMAKCSRLNRTDHTLSKLGFPRMTKPQPPPHVRPVYGSSAD
jgi:hypothetical protein